MKPQLKILDWPDVELYPYKNWFSNFFYRFFKYRTIVLSELNDKILLRNEEMIAEAWQERYTVELIALLRHLTYFQRWKNYYFLPKDNIKVIFLFWPDDKDLAMANLEYVLNDWGLLINDFLEYCPDFAQEDRPYFALENFTDFLISKKNFRSFWETMND